jgi:hypothetical protein
VDKIILHLLMFFAAVTTMGCGNEPEFVLRVEAPTPVYENYPTDGPPTGDVLVVLHNGDSVVVIDTEYAKDTAYYHIQLDDGRKGYVGWSGKFNIEPTQGK